MDKEQKSFYWGRCFSLLFVFSLLNILLLLFFDFIFGNVIMPFSFIFLLIFLFLCGFCISGVKGARISSSILALVLYLLMILWGLIVVNVIHFDLLVCVGVSLSLSPFLIGYLTGYSWQNFRR